MYGDRAAETLTVNVSEWFRDNREIKQRSSVAGTIEHVQDQFDNFNRMSEGILK